MAWGPDSEFHTRVKQRLGKKATEITENKIRAMILLLPRLAERVSYYLKLHETPMPVKRALTFLLIYLYHPKDFLPEESRGLFGYVDDAYFMTIAYEDLIYRVRKARCGPMKEDIRILKTLSDLKKTVRRLLSEEAPALEAMYQDIQQGKTEPFFCLINGENQRVARCEKN
jgi:uncharacterized membrane protein YkvA (DUF1232 family)